MAQLRSRTYRALGLLAAALAVAGLIAWFVIFRGPPPAVYDIPRTVRYTVTVRNPTNLLVEDAKFWVFAPVAQTAFQRVLKIDATLPHAVEDDTFGNQRLWFTVDIPPYGTKNVSIDVQLELASAANWLETPETDAFLAAEDKIESDAEEIIALATSLKRKSELDTANSIFGWVSTSIKYAGYVKDDRGALQALRERRGDCTEYSYLYTGLARAAGIPTRPMGGFVTAEDAVLRARDFHNWAEVYLDGRWRIIDPQNKRNRENEHHHIAMRVLGAGGQGLSSTHQMVGAEEGLEIRMN